MFRHNFTKFIATSYCAACLVSGLHAEKVPDQPKVEALVELLGDEQFSVRQEAEAELKEFGESAEKFLQAFREHQDPEIRLRVEGVLNHIASLRRELKWIDPKHAGKGEYISKSTGRGVKLTFRNLSKKPIRIFWIDTRGNKQPWRGVLKPGATAVCDRSFKTHVWLITDEQEKALGLYKIDMDDPVIAVRDNTGK
ncbi:MAG: hypothetical protein AB8D78_02425 [Akkermansiaceae bacterium]